jgi:hypothetical protein
MSMVGNFLRASSCGLLDVDKDWHCLHFLLTGTAWEGYPPLNFIAIGGREVGEEDVGYGPARGFASSDLKAISRALEAIDHAELPRRFDSRRMNELEIYPSMGGSWAEVDPNSEESFGCFSCAFDSLRNLVRRPVAPSVEGEKQWLCPATASS